MRRILALCPLLFLYGCPAPLPPVPVDAPVTYDTVSKAVFSSCSTRSCHGAEGKRGGLQLTSDVAYAQLVGVAATHDAAAAKGKLRVKPGDPDASYLIQKLEGAAAGEGNRMPPQGQALPPETLALVRRWVAAGCPK